MKRFALALILLVLVTGSLAAHDLFLKPRSFFVAPGAEARLNVLNGTFTSSVSSVSRDRVRDLSVVGPGGVEHPDMAAWSDGGDTSGFAFRAGETGTYIVGASTLPRGIKLDGKQFNGYLASDGVPDVLEARRRAGALDQPAHERYSKHVKTVLQVGSLRTGTFETVLGYPAELVPLDNPYDVGVGGSIRVRALVDGMPVANQFIVAGGRTPTGKRHAVHNYRSDSTGTARIAIPSRGHWYVKFIHMVPVEGDSVNYESKWASLTFQIR